MAKRGGTIVAHVTTRRQLDELVRILDEHPGSLPIVLVIGSAQQRVTRGVDARALPLLEEWFDMP